MNILEKVITIFIITIMLFSVIVLADNEPEIYSEGAILIEANTGTILYEKNANEVFEPASTTKILTALIALEKCDLNEVATASSTAINGIPSNYAIADIRVGEQFTIEQLLNVLLIHSANEAANVIAEYVAGSQEHFAELMNKRAKELGCQNSNFVNANGIENENHYTTAYDLAMIMKQCVKNENFKKIISTEKYALPTTELNSETRSFPNNNSLIIKGDKYYYEYCVGGKTGYTKEAKNCMVSLASKDGMDLIAVVLKGETTPAGESARNRDTINLFEYGYNNYNLQTIKKKGETITSVNIKDSEGNTKQLKVKLENDISVVNKDDDKNQKDVKPEINVNVGNIPIKKDEVVGTATYKVNGEEYKANLLAAETIEEDTTTENNKNILIVTIIKIIISIILLVIIIKMFAKVKINKRNKQRYKRINKKQHNYSRRGKHSI